VNRLPRHPLLAVLVLALVPLLGGLAAAQTPSPPGTYQRVVDITLPVSGDVRYGDDYHASRGGGTRVHQATDLFGEKLQGLHAAVDGEICFITGFGEPMPTWGYSVSLCGDDGLVYRYIHMNNDTPGTDDGLGGPEWAYAPGIREGIEVERGQWLGYLGDSGNAEGTPPHLHFEIRDPELVDPELAQDRYEQGRINPYPSLESARRRGDLPTPPGQPDPPDPPQRPDPPEQPDLSEGIRRLAGLDRIGTAIALSQERVAARTVIVVPYATHAEALVAAPLAGLLGAPVLLSSPDRLDDEVADEIRRLGAVNAYVIGRSDQLSAEVERDLTAAGIVGQARLAARSPLALSAEVAAEMQSYPEFAGGADRVFVALGESDDPSRAWPDALSASALAAQRHAPILLVRTGELPESVAQVLGELDPSLVTVVGGPVAVSDEVVDDVAAAVPGAEVERLAGENRYATSVQVAAEARSGGMDGRTAWIATGLNFPDALAAGPAAARNDAPLLLVDGLTPGASPDTDAWLAGAASTLDGAVLVGGSAAISDPVRDEILRLVDS
jgi:putative cell wall-binding protein